MKKALLVIFILFCSVPLYSAEPLIKFYLNDGSSKQFNLADIDSISVLDKKNNYVMRIHYLDPLVAYYPTEIIGSIKIEKDSSEQQNLNVYIFTYPKNYVLSTIDSIILYIDKYQPLTIGSQVWMLKNLNVDHYRDGSLIPEVRDSLKWYYLKTGAWCYYDNDQANDSIYGKLYNWYSVNEPRGLAPIGWHIPSDAEWTILTKYLGKDSVAIRKLKESGTEHWWSPNKGATNESGFSALPGGYRIDTHSYVNAISFWLIGAIGSWWSSTTWELEDSYAWGRSVGHDDTHISRDPQYKWYGYSVRCIKDK